MLQNTQQLLERFSCRDHCCFSQKKDRQTDSRPQSITLLHLLTFPSKQTAAQIKIKTQRVVQMQIWLSYLLSLFRGNLQRRRIQRERHSVIKRWENNETLNSANTPFNRTESNIHVLCWNGVCGVSRWKNWSARWKTRFPWRKKLYIPHNSVPAAEGTVTLQINLHLFLKAVNELRC